MNNKACVTLLVSILTALALNFGFDWHRRYDFAQEKEEIRQYFKNAVKEVNDQLQQFVSDSSLKVDHAAAIVSDLDDAYSEFLSSHTHLMALATRVPGEESASIPDDNRIPEAEEVEPASQRPNLRLFSSSTDDMLADMDSERDPFIKETYGEVRKPPNQWPDDATLLETFEDSYGVTLTEHDRELLLLRVQAYRAATMAAWSTSRAVTHLAGLDRVARGDYDHILDTGEYEEDPDINREDVFASTLEETYRLQWTRSGDPTVYRHDIVRRWIPLIMLQDLASHFEERRAQ